MTPDNKIEYRSIEIRKSDVNTDERTIELSFSSEEPYERYWGIEILDHSKESVVIDRLNNAAPLLLHHDNRDQIGVVEKAWVDDRRGKALVRFSRSARAEEIYQDVLDGIRRNVSVGYIIHEMILEKEEEGMETYRVKRWEPLEISIVPVPADNSVGVGRSKTIKDKEGESCPEKKKVRITLKLK
jgi:HK97 family phage prohead protease